MSRDDGISISSEFGSESLRKADRFGWESSSQRGVASWNESVSGVVAPARVVVRLSTDRVPFSFRSGDGTDDREEAVSLGKGPEEENDPAAYDDPGILEGVEED